MKHINLEEQLMKFLSHKEFYRLMRCTRLMSSKVRSEILLMLLFELKFKSIPVIDDSIMRLVYAIVKDEVLTNNFYNNNFNNKETKLW